MIMTNWIKLRQKGNVRVVQLESTHGCKHPYLDSGATPIGSAGRAPDKKQFRLQNDEKGSSLFDSYGHSTEGNNSPCLKLYFGQSLGGY